MGAPPRCPEHEALHAARDAARRRARGKPKGYSSGNWQRVRREVLERAGYLCEVQVPRVCLGVASSVDMPAHLGDDHRTVTADQCYAVCLPCHGAIDGGRAHPPGGVGTSRPTAA